MNDQDDLIMKQLDAEIAEIELLRRTVEGAVTKALSHFILIAGFLAFVVGILVAVELPAWAILLIAGFVAAVASES
jgi:hypothetical protein